jgi:rare lipoprotein A
MNQLRTVNPEEAGEREEAGAKPTMRIETKMFPETGVPGGYPVPANNADEFAVVDNGNAVKPQAVVPQSHYQPTQYHAPVEELSPGGLSAPANTGFFVQAGTFSMQENAMDLIDKLSDADAPQAMEVILNGKKFYRVMTGPYNTRDDAKNMLSKLTSMGISDAKLIHN